MEIEERISKKKEEIARIEKRIAKWTEGMNPEAIEIAKSLDYQTYRTYVKEHENDETVFRQDWCFSKGPNLSEAYSAYYNLRDAKRTLEKYEKMLVIKEEKSQVVKVEVIWNFLLEYKDKLNKFFHRNAERYAQLKKEENAAFEEWKKTKDYIWQVNIFRSRYHAELNWRKKYYSEIHSITRDLYRYNGLLDEARLEKMLNADIENRYFKLVEQVKKYVGAIVNADELKIVNGELNGTILGEKGKCYVMTIGAGGWNIQCFHYRTIVKPCSK